MTYDKDATLPAFIDSLLEALDMVPTPWRRAFMREWERWENTGARFNPYATTRVGLEWPEDPNWNNNQPPVKNYRDFDAGVSKTVTTMKLHHYTEILATLRNQHISDSSTVAHQLRVWGTIGFARSIGEGWAPRSVPEPQPPEVAEEVELLGLHVENLYEQLYRTNAAVLARFSQLQALTDAMMEGVIIAGTIASKLADPKAIPPTYDTEPLTAQLRDALPGPTEHTG